MRFLRNLTADVVLIVGLLLLFIVAIPFIMVEVLFHSGILQPIVWIAIAYGLYRLFRSRR